MTARLTLAVACAIAISGIQILRAQSQGHPVERTRLLQTRACDGCDLSGESFHAMDLKGVSLSDANLTSAVFYKANLTGAFLGGADLSKAVLPQANLTNANLGRANLTGANLTDAIGADLSGAITTDTTTCPNGQAGPCR